MSLGISLSAAISSRSSCAQIVCNPSYLCPLGMALVGASGALGCERMVAAAPRDYGIGNPTQGEIERWLSNTAVRALTTISGLSRRERREVSSWSSALSLSWWWVGGHKSTPIAYYKKHHHRVFYTRKTTLSHNCVVTCGEQGKTVLLPQPHWLLHVPRIIEELRRLPVPVLDRATIEKLFGLKRRQAILLLHRFGGYQSLRRASRRLHGFLESSGIAVCDSGHTVRTDPVLSGRLADRVAGATPLERSCRILAQRVMGCNRSGDSVCRIVQPCRRIARPHMVVIGAVIPYLLLVGIPLLIRQFVQRLRSSPRPEE